MKINFFLFVSASLLFACRSGQTSEENQAQTINQQDLTDTLFYQIADFPIITDSIKFMADLRRIYQLEVDESSYQRAHEKITVYKKVQLYGSSNELILIEYDYGGGAGAAFPWKHQLLLTNEGQLIKTFEAIRFEFVEIFPSEDPFLMVLTGTEKGNGGHAFYKITGDTLENVYEPHEDYQIRTYDAHEDNAVNQPFEAILTVSDANEDGYNDLIFNWTIIYLQGQTEEGETYDGEINDGISTTFSIENPFKKDKVKLVFLFDSNSQHFKIDQALSSY